MNKKFGEVLVDAGLITPEQLENALILQKGKNKRLGKVITELAYVTGEQVAEALSRQLSLPLVDCGTFKIDKKLLSIIPKEIVEKKIVFPLEKKDLSLLLAMADPLAWGTIDEISFITGLRVSVAVASEINILDAIEKHYGSVDKTWALLNKLPTYKEVEFIKPPDAKAEREVNVQTLYKSSSAPPIIKLVATILADAVKSGASDVHVEPMDQYVQVRYRIDGDLRNIFKYPKNFQDSVISRIKIISDLDITNRRLPQDGRSTLRLEDRNIDLRISTLPSVYGEKIVIRLLDRSTGLVPLSRLGVSDHILKPMIELFSQPQGMILVTGPTGSGKTTTLYAILQQLQNEADNVVTIEDPVEYKLDGITQVGINDAIGLSFAAALRSILRQDPDVIMVGEIRDLETAEIAARSALTGHLVLSTIHTNDTISTISRLTGIGLPPYIVSSAVSGIFAQRLVRRICTHCKTETAPPLELMGDKFPPLKVYYKGTGCNNCQHTGYRGQVGIYEFLPVDANLKKLIAMDATEHELWSAARESGLVTLFEDAWGKVKEGLTTVEEVIAKIPYKAIHTGIRGLEEEHKTRVLLYNVPDTEQSIISTTLDPDSYEVIQVTGEEFMEATRRTNPDIILIVSSQDLFTSLKELRSDIRYAYTPVFVLASPDETTYKDKGFELGIKDLIYRPIDPRNLFTMIDHCLKVN